MVNNCKNSHYKSAVEFYTATLQALPVTALVANPITLNIGNRVTDTGVAFETTSNGVYIETSGLYRAKADIEVEGTTAGDVTFALALNGEILPETLRTVTLVADASQIVPLETVRRLFTCCQVGEWNISVVAFSDGTAVGTVNRVSGNIIKLA